MTSPLVPAEPSPTSRRQVWSWWLWDLGFSPLNSVMISFVFSVYVTSAVAGSPERGQQAWSDAQAIAGVILALLAPLMGSWADRVRNRRRMLSLGTLVAITAVAACWFVQPHPSYLLLGVVLLAVASLVQDIAGIFYNGMLLQVSTPANIGRVSSIGWGSGYLGGVVCLVIALFGFVLGGGLLHLPTTSAVNIRAIALASAAFMLVFTVPLMLWGPTNAPVEQTGRFHPLTAYKEIITRIAHMRRDEPKLLHFLLASAVFRDGLTAVFSFGGVIAASSYGFTQSEVVIFGIAANVIALLGTWGLSGLDDKIGPRWVIIGCLSIMVVAGVIVIAWHAKPSFWICGLVISSLVGLVQSASRTLLARIVPEGEENETFGLYATVGRAASPLAPALIALFTAVAGVRWGILGIVATLLLGLAIFATLRIPGVTHDRAPRQAG